MTRAEFHKRSRKIPDAPGVYFFIDIRKKFLYIGKAASLRDRVRSYFSHDLPEVRSPAIAGMVEKATSIKWQKTDSVLEALILEANFIKRYQPPFNIDQKDNKSWNYVVITKEEYPRILLVRGRELFYNHKLENYGLTKPIIFGPYPHGGQLQEALRIIRKIFPFRDKCIPQTGKPCFNRQIGLCPGVCSGEVNEKEYSQTVRNIRDMFGGNFKGLKRRLETEMKSAARAEDFERAKMLRRQVLALKHIHDVSLIKNSRIATGGSVNSKEFRIEAYDVAHTAGVETVGVVAVIEDGEVAKAEYRTFKIGSVSNDDTKALTEMLARRLAHTEWRLPRLVVVDGGKAQVNAARRVLERAGVGIPVVGVVKDEFHRPRDIIGEAGVGHEQSVLLGNNEAHRFALAFHRKRRGRLTG